MKRETIFMKFKFFRKKRKDLDADDERQVPIVMEQASEHEHFLLPSDFRRASIASDSGLVRTIPASILQNNFIQNPVVPGVSLAEVRKSTEFYAVSLIEGAQRLSLEVQNLVSFLLSQIESNR